MRNCSDFQVPRGRAQLQLVGSPGRDPPQSLPKHLKLSRRLLGATAEFLQLCVGDGMGSVPLTGPAAEKGCFYEGLLLK